MSPVCKMTDSGLLTVDQKVKVVLFYAETKSVVATQRSFPAHFGTRQAPCKQTIYRPSSGIIFQPMRINSVPDIKCFCNNKNVLCVQSMVWHFVRHPVYTRQRTVYCVPLADKKCGNYGAKFIYAPQNSMAFVVPIYTNSQRRDTFLWTYAVSVFPSTLKKCIKYG